MSLKEADRDREWEAMRKGVQMLARDAAIVRAFEAGEDIQRCEEHGVEAMDEDGVRCWYGFYEDGSALCRMVSRRVCPPIEGEEK